MTREEFAEVIREVLRDEMRHVPLAPKWEGGVAVLKPRDPGLQPKEIPLDQLFHKVVMIRDRLRVLEQKINANDKLSSSHQNNALPLAVARGLGVIAMKLYADGAFYGKQPRFSRTPQVPRST